MHDNIVSAVRESSVWVKLMYRQAHSFSPDVSTHWKRKVRRKLFKIFYWHLTRKTTSFSPFSSSHLTIPSLILSPSFTSDLLKSEKFFPLAHFQHWDLISMSRLSLQRIVPFERQAILWVLILQSTTPVMLSSISLRRNLTNKVRSQQELTGRRILTSIEMASWHNLYTPDLNS